MEVDWYVDYSECDTCGGNTDRVFLRDLGLNGWELAFNWGCYSTAVAMTKPSVQISERGDYIEWDDAMAKAKGMLGSKDFARLEMLIAS